MGSVNIRDGKAYGPGVLDMKGGVVALLYAIKALRAAGFADADNGFGTPYAKVVGGGADSAYTVAAGVPTVCAMGVKGGRNHSPEEYAVVDSLFERAKLLAACVLNFNKLPSPGCAKTFPKKNIDM